MSHEAAVVEGFELSPQQRRLWQLASEGRGGGRSEVLLRFDGPLDLERWRRALALLAERCELLSVALALPAGVTLPLLEPRPPLTIEIEQADLRQLPAVQRAPALESWLQARRAVPFALTGNAAVSWLRVGLVRLDLMHPEEAEQALWLAVPALISDAAGVRNLAVDLLHAYRFAGGDGEAPELALAYLDLAAWLEESLHAEGAEEGRRYWQAKDLTAPPPRPAVGRPQQDEAVAPAYLPARVRLEEAPPVERVEALARDLEVTPAAVYLGAWLVLWARLEEASRLRLAVDLDGRHYAELTDVIGPCARTVPFVLSREPGRALAAWPLAEVVRRVQAQWSEDEQWQECFAWENLEAAATASESRFGFAWETPWPRLPAVAETCRVDFAACWGEPFALQLLVADGGRHLDLLYDGNQFTAAEVERLGRTFGALLTDALARPRVAAAALQALDPREPVCLVADSGLGSETAPLSSVVARFEWQAVRQPHAPALVDGATRFTYSELEHASRRLAERLRGLGVGTDAVVAIEAERTAATVVALLAVLRAGGAYLMLDPQAPAARRQQLREQSGARVLIHGTGEIESGAAVPNASGARARLPEPVPEGLAYVLFTSGSTGRPKAVGVEHRQLANYVHSLHERHPEVAGNCALASTFAADLGNTVLYAALTGGGCLHVLDDATVADPEIFASRLEAAEIDSLKIVPSHYEALLGGADPARAVPRQALVLGGEALPPRLLRQVAELAPHCRVIHHYGPTETTVGVLTVQVAGPGVAGLPVADIPLGAPLAGTYAAVLGGGLVGGLAPVPLWAAGELYLGGAHVTRGYLGQPARTAERFVPDPFAGPRGGHAGGRLYRSGDRVRRLLDGELVFLGRTDQQVKIRGFRVEPGEVEVVLRGLPEVRAAVVDVRRDGSRAEAGGHGEARLVAYVVPASTARSGDLPATLRAELARRLPEAMVPAVFVELERLPLTANGKVDRQALPAPEHRRRQVAPRTPRETQMAAIWCQVLGLEDIGVEDDFFALGGDSILSIQVVAKAQRAGWQLSARDLFRHSTIAALAALSLDAGDSETAAVPAAPEATGDVPLAPIQRWYFEQPAEPPHHFNQTLILELTEAVPGERLERALDAVAAAHGALRLRFHPEGTQRDGATWRQELVDHAQVGFERHRLEVATAADWPAALDAFLPAFERSLDLQAGPLLRAALLEAAPLDGVLLDGAAGARLVLAAHHLVVDGVSWRILLEDLSLALASLALEQTPELLPEAATYAAWARARVAWAGSHGDAAAEAWLQYLGPAPGATHLSLPCDSKPQATGETLAQANTIASAAQVHCSLDAERTRQLLRSAPAAYRLRPDELLLAALAATLAEWSGQPRIELELEGHGRGEDASDDLDLSRTVGWFTSRYPVLLDVPAAAQGVRALLLAVKEQLRQLPAAAEAYGAGRYLATGEAAAALAARPHPAVAFNYFGRFDTALPASGPLRLAGEQSQHQRAPDSLRRQLLDISAVVLEDRLQVSWIYSRAVHRTATIEGLAERFEAWTQALLDHCLAAEAGGLSPSDVPLAGLDQARLDALFPASQAAEVEDIYPLSPLQEGILFHSLAPASADSNAYLSASSCTFRGALDLASMRQVWQQALARHPILRTAFRWRDLDRPLQVVHRQLQLDWQELDWRDMSPQRQQEGLRQLEQERLRAGCELDRPPLFSLWWIRLADDAWRFFWLRHHLLLEGWSTALLLDEVLAHYQALVDDRELGHDREHSTFTPPRRPPFRDYIAWLRAQDLQAADGYWRQLLAGFGEPTPLPVPGAAERASAESASAESASTESASAESSYQLTQRALPAAAFERLQQLVRRHRLTLNTLGQGFWALLLAQHSGRDDVVFGSVGAGRPPSLDGSGAIIGMLINTLPVRVDLPPQLALSEWLRRLQQQQAEQRDFEHTPLVRIQALSELPRQQPLFESFYVFENYPPIERADSLGGVEIVDVDHYVRNSYPLTLRLLPESGLRLDLLHDVRRVSGTAAERILARLELLFEQAETLLDGDVAAALHLLETAGQAEQERQNEAYDAAVMGRLRRRARSGSQPDG